MAPVQRAMHPKAKKIHVNRESTQIEEEIDRLINKIGNKQRLNTRFIKLIEDKVKPIRSVTSMNVAEIFYNGAPGIEVNYDKTMHYYVCALEGDDVHSNDEILSFVCHNYIEVHKLCALCILPLLAERLEAVNKDVAKSLGLMTLARHMDLNSKWREAKSAYIASKMIADSCLRKDISLECEERISILECILECNSQQSCDVSDETKNIQTFFSQKRKELRDELNIPMEHATESPPIGNIIRMHFEAEADKTDEISAYFEQNFPGATINFEEVSDSVE